MSADSINKARNIGLPKNYLFVFLSKFLDMIFCHNIFPIEFLKINLINFNGHDDAHDLHLASQLRALQLSL